MNLNVYSFVGEQIGESVLEWRECKRCGDFYPVYSGDKSFLEKLSPVVGGEVMSLPLPELCFSCRRMKRLMFRNESKLYKRKSSKSGKTLISVYSEDSPLKVYDSNEYFVSDSVRLEREETDLSDFSGMFKTLIEKAPHINLQNGPNMENSEYNTLSGYLRNCYLCFDCGGVDTGLYSGFIGGESYKVFDCFDGIGLQNTYECVGVENGMRSFFCQESDNLYNCYFCVDSSNLQNCMGCIGLKNQSYCVFNEKVSPEEFERLRKEYFDGTYSGLKRFAQKFHEFQKKVVLPESHRINTLNVFGDYISDSQNILFGWFTYRSEDSRYTFFSTELSNCMDVDFCVEGSEKVYNSIMSGNNCFGLVCCKSMDNCSSCYYCDFCQGCSDCIGCFGLVNEQYCIFNKQYTKEEYMKLAKELIEAMKERGVWGSFFDTQLSPFPFNDTVANDFFPVRKEVLIPEERIEEGDIQDMASLAEKSESERVLDENGKGVVYVLQPDKFVSSAILDLGGKQKIRISWRTAYSEISVPEGMESINSENIEDSIYQISEDILEKAVLCQETGKPFRITRTEFEFYREFGIPMPRLHPEVRQNKRRRKRSYGELYLRKCDKCNKTVISEYMPKTEKVVYCNECYVDQ